MIHVALLLESAVDGHKKILGHAGIANDGTGTQTRGNYNAVIINGIKGRRREARVENFPRKSKSAWSLLRLALNDLHDRGELP